MKVGIVVPHFFMNKDILPKVIFSPGNLAIDLCEGLQTLGVDVTLFSPGPVETFVKNISVDLSYFEDELDGRGYDYIELLKKHPQVFISLARQAQSEIIAKAYEMANNGDLDLVHIYTNEEDIALPFAKFCEKPVVFTHHDPFNYLIRYKHVFPKYKDLNWLSISYSQREGMPEDTNWVANIYHGIDPALYEPNYKKQDGYIAYLGRIIKPKGLHIAIKALKIYNKKYNKTLKLKIAGKHYSGFSNDEYWKREILPEVENDLIEFVGLVKTTQEKQDFLSSAKALIMPSVFEEPFGIVAIESLACGTPVIAIKSGALPELIDDDIGILVDKIVGKDGELNDEIIAADMALAINKIDKIDRKICRQRFEDNFTLGKMCKQHFKLYEELTTK